jgi:hypothetical protein
MKDTDHLQTSRRAVLAGTGLTLAGTALSSSAADAGIGAGTAATAAQAPSQVTVILQDRRFELPEEVSTRLAGNGARVVPLEEDPVRMWRGELAPLLAAPGTRLLGATRWPEFLMVSGLAAESGRRVLYQRLDAASGAIVWLIA